MEYNASKIQEAVEVSVWDAKVVYSATPGANNPWQTMLLSGTPKQQRETLARPTEYCILFAPRFLANGSSMVGPLRKRTQTHCHAREAALQVSAGYEWALSITVLNQTPCWTAYFHKLMVGAQSFLQDGCRTGERHTRRTYLLYTGGVMEEHTTPEALEMMTTADETTVISRTDRCNAPYDAVDIQLRCQQQS
jgi:hypothetical protein